MQKTKSFSVTLVIMLVALLLPFLWAGEAMIAHTEFSFGITAKMIVVGEALIISILMLGFLSGILHPLTILLG